MNRCVMAAELTPLIAGIFGAHGAPPDVARVVADSLVEASLLGHDSHGILRVGRYVEKIRAGTLHPGARPTVQRRCGATAVVDGALGFGQVTARFGADLASELARAHGIGAVALARTNHVGRLGEYAARIAAAGQIALAFAAGAGPGGSVALHGGRERLLGTNPLAWAMPVPPGTPALLADFSTSAIPEGKIGVAQARGEALPAGAILDRAGKPSTDPADFYAGGVLLPFGGHKGSSLVLFIELAANLLAGATPVASRDYRPGNPALLLAISVDAFMERADFLRYTEELLERARDSAPAEGNARVLLPHQFELETEQERRAQGIPIPPPLWDELATLARDGNVPLPSA